MNSKFYLAAALTLSTLSQTHAADKKTDARREAMVAAVQTVSPDALGGRLGLNLASTLAAKSASRMSVAKSTARSTDLATYQTWKRAKKS
jgi:hypothetical protein